jgi:hypothetical protein
LTCRRDITVPNSISQRTFMSFTSISAQTSTHLSFKLPLLDSPPYSFDPLFFQNSTHVSLSCKLSLGRKMYRDCNQKLYYMPLMVGRRASRKTGRDLHGSTSRQQGSKVLLELKGYVWETIISSRNFHLFVYYINCNLKNPIPQALTSASSRPPAYW